MTCIIIEDQPPAQRILKKYISDLGTLQLKGTFNDAIQAMSFLKTEQVDLIFLDIHLPKISGIDFLKALPHSPHVILTTAFPDYALESYDLDVIDYLLKPFSFQRFVKAVAKVPVEALSEIKVTELERKEIFIKSGYEHIKINISDILYIQSDGDYTEIYLTHKKLLSSEPLRYWEQVLNDQQFMRIHKSYLIQISKIEKIVGNQVFLLSEHVIPIGRAFREKFIKRMFP